jgi:NAD dependent epimerase/dehydratase family enzyme
VHRPSWLPVPSLALKAGLGEFSGVLTSGQRAIPSRVLESGYEFEFTDLQLALKNLLE